MAMLGTYLSALLDLIRQQEAERERSAARAATFLATGPAAEERARAQRARGEISALEAARQARLSAGQQRALEPRPEDPVNLARRMWELEKRKMAYMEALQRGRPVGVAPGGGGMGGGGVAGAQEESTFDRWGREKREREARPPAAGEEAPEPYYEYPVEAAGEQPLPGGQEGETVFRPYPRPTTIARAEAAGKAGAQTAILRAGDVIPGLKDTPLGGLALGDEKNPLRYLGDATALAVKAGYLQTPEQKEAAKNATWATLRQRLKAGLRSPGSVDLAVLRPQFESAGLDWGAERANMEAEVRKEQGQVPVDVTVAGQKLPLAPGQAAGVLQQQQVAGERVPVVIGGRTYSLSPTAAAGIAERRETREALAARSKAGQISLSDLRGYYGTLRDELAGLQGLPEKTPDTLALIRELENESRFVLDLMKQRLRGPGSTGSLGIGRIGLPGATGAPTLQFGANIVGRSLGGPPLRPQPVREPVKAPPLVSPAPAGPRPGVLSKTYRTPDRGVVSRETVSLAIQGMMANGLTRAQIRAALAAKGIPPEDFGY